MLKEAYAKQGINYQYVHAQFKDLIVKTLMSVEPHITQHVQKNPKTPKPQNPVRLILCPKCVGL